MLKNQLKFIITIVLVLGLSISLQSLIAAWQAPSASAPGGNLDAPINTSLFYQVKSGSLDVLGSFGADSAFITNNLITMGDIYMRGQRAATENYVNSKNFLSLSGFGGPVCIFANSCDPGWVDKGLAGFISNSAASCPYGTGSGYYSWVWCHPRLCCNS